MSRFVQCMRGHRLAAALVASVAVLAALPACDSAPATGVVSADKDKIKPGENKTESATPPPAAVGATKGHSIKDPRPGT